MLSHPVRGAWIEIALGDAVVQTGAVSHPVRGAWIEIVVSNCKEGEYKVASRKGCVD